MNDMFCLSQNERKCSEGAEARPVLLSDWFNKLDAFQAEGYEWAQNVLGICGPLTGHRSDLVPCALTWMVDDYLSHVLGYGGQDWESLLDEYYVNQDEIWDRVWKIRGEIAKRLLSKVDGEEVCRSLEKLTEHEVEDEPGVFRNQLSFTQQLELRSFVSNGLM
ncbi:hypothetical protein H6778_03625 [Candidatus Nomurabacteria bacterium]|uniref:Uncharacterized protein n=1 Tax=candidate division WWE3 bacterium TaxID=2053526 RepID=A0A955LVU1_UNCKA|nr:hypothetical protein [candidate division WWE3 bacterium]MCB9812719.1 hypothetical protein [Candidatus Nomurabacteria bacterium]